MSQESLQEAPSASDFDSDIGQQSQQTTPAERTFTQADVDKIAGKVRRGTIEKLKSEQVATPSANYSANNFSIEDFRRTAIEEARNAAAQVAQEQFKAEREQILQQQYAAEGQRIADEFRSKIDAAKDKFPDLKDKLANTNLAAFASVIHMSNSVENTAEVVNELWENPSKLALINLLAQSSPSQARQELVKLSSSLSLNEKAANVKIANEPLSQLKPSKIGMDNGSMSVTDYRKQAFLR